MYRKWKWYYQKVKWYSWFGMFHLTPQPLIFRKWSLAFSKSFIGLTTRQGKLLLNKINQVKFTLSKWFDWRKWSKNLTKNPQLYRNSSSSNIWILFVQEICASDKGCRQIPWLGGKLIKWSGINQSLVLLTFPSKLLLARFGLQIKKKWSKKMVQIKKNGPKQISRSSSSHFHQNFSSYSPEFQPNKKWSKKTVKTKKMIRNKSATHPPSSHFPQNFHQLRLSSHEPKLQTKKTLWRTLASNHPTHHTTCHLSISLWKKIRY